MNKSVTTLFIAATLLVPNAYALAREENRLIEADPDGRVTVINTSGSVELSGWSRNEVEVTADVGSDVEELIVERNGDEILIEVRIPKRSNRNTSGDLIIRVPEESDIDIGVVSADIEVSGVSGEQTLHSVSGDISSMLDSADNEMESVSGDITLTGRDQSMDTEVSTVSGDIEVTRVSGSIDATSVSGDIVIMEGSFERVIGNTVNGSLDFKAELIDDGKLDFETINGRVDVHFVGDIFGRFDLETFNGRIRNCFGPSPERTSRYTPGRELQFTDGKGSSRVTIQTLNGGIKLCRD